MDQLVQGQFDRYGAWLEAMDEAGVERRLFVEAGGYLLRAAWNPVRLNRQGTIELRGMDSNYPEVTLTAAALVVGAADRVRREGLTVVPDDGVRAFEVDGETLRVPGFGYLGGELLRAAVTGGPESEEDSAYVDSVLSFAGGEGRLAALRSHRAREGRYPTTEARILEGYAPHDAHLPEETGLRLVLKACDRLEAQAFRQEGEIALAPEAFARMPARQAR